MVYNKIYAQIGEERHITLDPVNYQYDVKQILVLTGETVPDYYEADVCNVGDTATLTMVGTAADGVEIPDKFLLDGRNVLVYVVIPGNGGDVQTRYDITIPVDERAEREDIDPSEAEQQQIDSLINALNSGVGRAEAAATAAEESATDAEGSAGESEDQAENAEAWAVGQRAGTDVGTEDPTYHNNSKYYAGMAEAAAEEAGQHEASWETWVQRAETAAGNAESSATAAGQSKTAAETAAQAAAQKATEAGNSAAAAAGSAASARQTVDGAIGAINTAKEGAVTQIGSAGSNAVGAVEQAGTTQTGRVTSEGNTQVNRVQAKGDEVLESIPPDYSDLVDDVADLTRHLNDETTGLDTKAPVILETVSGAIASFDDGADSMPIRKLVAQIEPVQDLHGYDNPWPAGGGKNLININDVSTLSPAIWEVSVSGNVLTVKRNTGSSNAPIVSHTLQAGTYCVSFAEKSLTIRINNITAGSSISTNVANGFTFTLESQAEVQFQFYIGSDNTTGTVSMLQLELGSTATTFQPYENLCPISGWTGAEISGTGINMWDEEWELGRFDTTTGANVSSTTQIRSKNFIPLKGGMQYYLKTPRAVWIIFFDKDKNPVPPPDYSWSSINGKSMQIANRVFQAPDSVCYCRFYCINDYGTTYNNDISINYPATDTEYHPYTGNQISVTFPPEAGTVYGGLIDLLNGKLEDSMWKVSTYNFGENTPPVAQNWISGYFSKSGTPIPIKAIAKIVCSVAPVVSWGSINSNPVLDKVYCWQATSSVGIAGPKSIVGETIAALNAWCTANNVDLICEVETPVEYVLSSHVMKTLYGVNNIFANSGDVAVDYPADTKLFIEKLTQPTEDDMTADHAISAGTFFQLGNTLYLATAAIAAGATITPGTNATKLSLADALNTLNT